jgi:hypothetical protein
VTGDELYPDRQRFAGKVIHGGGHYTATIIMDTEQMSALADLLYQFRYNQREGFGSEVTVLLPPNYQEALIQLQSDLFYGGR